MTSIFNPFTLQIPTKILFGRGRSAELPEHMRPYGRRVLLVYGGGSIKKTGLYAHICELLKDFEVFELSGVDPSPRITSVNAGGRLCREQHIDMVLAVGGGSVLDCCKLICDAALYEGDAWDLVLDPAKIKGALPLFAVLTLAATGSDFNCGAGITSLERKEKRDVIVPCNYPKVSVLDPALTMTVSRRQTAAGCADIISHVLEQYLVGGSAMLTDGLCEALLRTVIKFGPRAVENGEDYCARANLLWASSLACSGLCALGSESSVWPAHAIEHEVAAYFDCTHGESLAVLTPVLLRLTLNEKSAPRYAALARAVFGVKERDDFAAARAGIKALQDLFAALGLPGRLSALGVDDRSQFAAMARHVCANKPLHEAFVALDEALVLELLQQSF